MCNHPAQIIKLQKEITDLKSQQFLHAAGDHTEIENQIWALRKELDDARRRPATQGTDDKLQYELADMTQDTR
jgi:hypothetical protein